MHGITSEASIAVTIQLVGEYFRESLQIDPILLTRILRPKAIGLRAQVYLVT